MSTALVTSSNLGADIDVGVQVANKLNIVKATTAIYGKMRFATSAEASAYTAGLVMDAATIGATFAPLASPALTGTPTAPTPAAGDNTTKIATTAWVSATYVTTATLASYAPLASPALTGTPTAPTPSAGDNSTNIATTAFVCASFATTASIAATYAPLASPTLTGTPTAPTPSAGDNSTKLATTAFVQAGLMAVNVGTATRSPVRQTVQTGPASSGAPSFLPASSSSLTLAAQNISATAPLIVSAAKGFNSSGAVDAITSLTSAPSWTATASATNYLFLNASTGAASVSSLQPIYQFGGTISTANGQFTFDYQGMVGYLGNGSAAVATPLVCVGECVATASAITSTIAYAYNGYYDSGWLGALPSSAVVSKNANLGLQGITFARMIIECTSADNGYSVGDEVIFQGTPSYSCEIVLWQSRNIVGFTNGGTYSLLTKSASAGVNITLANWKYKLIAQRGF